MREFEREKFKKVIEQKALQEEVTPREICLRNIERWQYLLRVFTRDVALYSDEQWEEMVERELDDRRRAGEQP